MEFFLENSVLSFLAISFGVKILFSFLAGKDKPKHAQYVGKVSRLVIYPVKSMKGVDVGAASCSQRGLMSPNECIFDRNFMVVNKSGGFISARAYPKLTTIRTRLEGENVQLDVDDMETLTLKAKKEASQHTVSAKVWGEAVQGQDCGDKAAAWISAVLGKTDFRMVYGAEGLAQRELNKRPTTWSDGTKPGDNVTYADGFPIMLLSCASVDDLNNRCPNNDVIIDQFRPNIVISGCPPYEEDTWFDVWIGDVKFSNLKPCQRCIFTTIDPRVGKKDEKMEPLRTLRKYRLLVPEFGESPCFGVNLVVDTPGKQINVGDPVYVLRK